MRRRRKRSNNTCSSIKTTLKSTKINKTVISFKPVRKARTKIKKPRFLSLSNTQMPPSNYHKQQLNLFPFHPKNVVVKDQHHHESHEDMADIFAYDDGGPTTLSGLLNAAISSSSYEGVEVARENSTTEGSVSSLVRTALRNRERDASEEKWVSIRDVVERSFVVSPAATFEEEVTSGVGGDCGGLWLKLDYEEVLNAWSGKGPFCIEAETESLQTVPDLHFDDFINHGGSCSSAGNNGQWSVPEDDFKGHIDHTTEIGDTFFGIDGWKLGLREASVLRYKAKRQSRLFSKRIRYEVRKQNAEKRPRIKGRFVRRCVDEEK